MGESILIINKDNYKRWIIAKILRENMVRHWCKMGENDYVDGQKSFATTIIVFLFDLSSYN